MVLVWTLVICWLANYIAGCGGAGLERTDGPMKNVTSLLQQQGYRATEYSVETADGYLLSLTRMRGRGGTRGSPVLLMPGLLQGATVWLDAGPTAGLAYLLADAGADVWLGNVRGTTFARRHAWLDPDADPHFWRFSVDEIGARDVPAIVRYVLRRTGADTLRYVGFSQGAAAFFVMCTEQPECCSKVSLVVALAPAVRLLNMRSIPFRIIFASFEKNEEQLNDVGIWEVFSVGGLFQSFMESFCAISDATSLACERIKDFLDASNPGSIAKATIRRAFSVFPAGTSVHNMAWYGQSIRSKRFQKFDYGPEQNLALYGVREPPAYNLSAATPPTLVVYGRNDGGVSPRDVAWLLTRLPNVIEAFEVKDPQWTHIDFVLSQSIPKYVYPKVKEYLDKYS